MTGDVFGTVDEVVNLCHGARNQHNHAIETCRRALELEARAHTGPVVPPGPPVQFNLNAAGHAFLADFGLRLMNEEDREDDESEDDVSVVSGWGRVRSQFGPNPIVWNDEEMLTQRDGNPQ